MHLGVLTERIAAAREEEDKWCTLEKAHALAAIVVATRPEIICEVGVWRGASLLPQLVALQLVGRGRAIAIDPWSPEASVQGETPVNAEWWKSIDHERSYQDFIRRMNDHGVASLCEIWRKRSDDCDPPIGVGLLHIDGNHTEQAYRDVVRFAPGVVPGGFLILDDLAWDGGGVSRGHELAQQLGFVDRYPIGTGIAMQRVPTSA